MVMSKAEIVDIIDRVDEYAKSARQAIEAAMPGTPLNGFPVSDEDFAKFYEQMTQQDPLWPLALPFVDGGMELITRYEKVRGLR